MSGYERYWEGRLEKEPNLKGTGHRAFDIHYNELLYQAQEDALNLMLARHQVETEGKRVLDVGSGRGFYVRFFKKIGARTVTGIDITRTGVAYLREIFPDSDFFKCDIGAEQIGINGSYDMISAMSVLYHLVDDIRFEQAIIHLGRLLSNGGYLLITDTFARPLLPSASHARFRTLETYRDLLLEQGVYIVDIVPVYYLLNRTFLPLIGPFMLQWKWLQRRLYEIDKRWREEGRDNGRSMKLMLAQKTSLGPRAV